MGLVIMMQRSKQEGLGAAFGGGFTESVWGAQTSQVLVKATVWLAALFFLAQHLAWPGSTPIGPRLRNSLAPAAGTSQARARHRDQRRDPFPPRAARPHAGQRSAVRLRRDAAPTCLRLPKQLPPTGGASDLTPRREAPR